MKYRQFEEYIEKALARFRSISGVFRVISHLDADGITSASIILNALNNEEIKYSMSVVRQLSEDILMQLEKEDYKNYIFTDLGSGQYDLIRKYLGGRNIFIFDHHSFDISIMESLPDYLSMVNPHAFGIDGSSEISGSGVTYLFSERLNPKNQDMAHLAIIGAIGDIQEKNGFLGLNNKILQTAEKIGKIKTEKGIKWFGIETKPLYKLITYATEPEIPGITGSESNAIQFLNEIGISPKIDDEFTRFNDLDEGQRSRLIAGLIMKRKNEKNPEDIFGIRYILLKEPESSPMRDAREFSTLLNACGRMDKASIGIGACLNDLESKKKAIELMTVYKSEIVNALKWYESVKDDKNHILSGRRYLIINAEDNIMATLIGTLASIISKSPDIEKGTLILSLARNSDGTTKVSLRVAGDDTVEDMREIIIQIAGKTSGESGGHKNAAGAIIKTIYEQKFIEETKKLFEEKFSL